MRTIDVGSLTPRRSGTGVAPRRPKQTAQASDGASWGAELGARPFLGQGHSAVVPQGCVRTTPGDVTPSCQPSGVSRSALGEHGHVPVGRLSDGAAAFAPAGRLAVVDGGRRVVCHACGDLLTHLSAAHIQTKDGRTGRGVRVHNFRAGYHALGLAAALTACGTATPDDQAAVVSSGTTSSSSATPRPPTPPAATSSAGKSSAPATTALPDPCALLDVALIEQAGMMPQNPLVPRFFAPTGRKRRRRSAPETRCSLVTRGSQLACTSPTGRARTRQVRRSQRA